MLTRRRVATLLLAGILLAIGALYRGVVAGSVDAEKTGHPTSARAEVAARASGPVPAAASPAVAAIPPVPVPAPASAPTPVVRNEEQRSRPTGDRPTPSAADVAYSDKVSRVFDEADAAFHRCFEGQDPSARASDGGRPVVRLSFTVTDHAGTGRVKEIQVLSSDFDNPLISQCLALEARALLFPPPGGRPEWRLSLELRPY